MMKTFTRSPLAPFRGRGLLRASAWLLLPLLLSSGQNQGAQTPGALDRTFDPTCGGQYLGLTETASIQVNAMAIQADGKVVIGGQFNGVDGAPRRQLARLNPDGSLDPLFRPEPPSQIYGVQAIVIQADGKILFADWVSIQRLLPDGRLDPSFQAATNTPVRALVLQPDARVIIGGGLGAPEYVDRLNPDGSHDPSFTRQEFWGQIHSLALQADGKILAGGIWGRDFVIRLNPNGLRDTNFNAVVDADVYAVRPTVNGKVVIGGGFWQVSGQKRHGLARLNADGSLDTSFNPATPSASGHPVVYSVLPLPDGRVLLGGINPLESGGSIDYTWGGLLLLELNSDGTENAAFTQGLGTLFNSQFQNVHALAIQPDGRILAGGRVFEQGLFRVWPGGNPDPTFAANLQGEPGSVSSLLPQPGGKVLAVGSFTSLNGVPRPGLTRLDAAGRLDTGFAPALPPGHRALSCAVRPDGKLVVSVAPRATTSGELWLLHPDGSRDTTFDPSLKTESFVGHTLCVQPDGGLLVPAYPEPVQGVAYQQILRVNPDGTMDTNFQATVRYGPIHDYSVRLLLKPQLDGTILAAGSFDAVNEIRRPLLARLLADGRLDNTFKPIYFPGETNYAHGVSQIEVQPDGRLLVGLTLLVESGSAPILLRLNPDGSLDPSFHLGSGATAAAEVASISALALQSDGKILAGGTFDTFQGVPQPNLVRLLPDGRLDTAFQVKWITPENEIEPWEIGSVVSLAMQSDGQILVGGYFKEIEGQLRWGIARLQGEPPAVIGPSLTRQPVSRTLFAGQDLVLNVGAIGSPPLLWQWFHNGEAIPGATNASWVLPSLSPVNAGFYSVSLSNAAGNVTSTAATLAVLPAPTGPGSLDLTFDPTLAGTQLGIATQGGEIAALLAQPDGRLLIGGDFLGYNGQSRKSIARLETDGQLDEGFNPGRGTDGRVLALAIQSDGKILIGGEFTVVDTQPRLSLARLQPDGSLDNSFLAPVGVESNRGSVRILAVQEDGKILVGGWFKRIQGSPRANLGRLNRDGTLDVSFDPRIQLDELYGAVRALWLLPEGKLLVGGLYGKDSRILYRLQADGTSDPAFAHPPSGLVVRALAVRPDGKIYASGDFDLPGETRPVSALVRLDADGALDPQFPVLKTEVATLHLQGDERLVITGWFDSIRNRPRHHLARLNPDGSVDENFDPGALVGLWGPQQGSILALMADGSFWLTGSFTPPNGTPSGLLRLRSDGTLDDPFHTAVGSIAVAGDEVSIAQALVQPDGRVMVGGHFDSINGQARQNLARLFPDGTLDTSFKPHWDTGLDVVAFARLPNGYWIVGGRGELVGPDLRRYAGVVRLDPEGFLDEAFHSPWSETWNLRLRCLALQADGKVIIGGEFENGLARLNSNGSLDDTFHPPLLPAYDGDAVHALLVQPDGKIWVGGTAGIGLFRLHPDGSLDPGFTLDAGWDVNVTALTLQSDGLLLVGGSFWDGREEQRRNLVRLWPDGRLDRNFQANVEIVPAEIAVTPNNRILVAGGASTVHVPAKIYQLFPDGALDPSFDANANTYLGVAAVTALAAQPDGRWLIGGNFTSVNGLPFNGLARLNNEATAEPPMFSIRPRSLTRFAGQSATFRASVTGTAPLTYQWSWNGVPLAGMTNSVLALGSLQLAQAGSYSVIVSNGWGAIGAVATLAVRPAPKGPGSVDVTFDPSQGGEELDFVGQWSGNPWDRAVSSLAVQPDGRMVLGGSFAGLNRIPRNNFARLNPAGDVDSAFDSSWGADGEVLHLARQADGKIILAGWFTSVQGVARGHLARLNPDGTLEPGFAPQLAGGNPTPVVWHAAVQADGKILVSGSFDHVNGLAQTNLVRLHPDGALDASFRAQEWMVGNPASVGRCEVLPDGRYLLQGEFPGLNRHLVRLHPDGALDATFDTGSAVSTLHALALQPDGKILLSVSEPAEESILRVNVNGDRDLSFTPASTGPERASQLAVLSDGKVVLVGRFNRVNGVVRNGIARLNPNGSLDQAFDPGALMQGARPDLMTALAQDGLLVLAEDNALADSNYYFYQVAENGTLTLRFQTTFAPASSLDRILPQPDGQILVGGWFTSVNDVARTNLARLTADGTIDPTFRDSHLLGQRLTCQALQPDGKVLVTGEFPVLESSWRHALSRFNPDGSVDQTFGGGLVDLEGVLPQPKTVALQPDGRILVGGYPNAPVGNPQPGLIRFNPDGSRDATFQAAPLPLGDDFGICTIGLQSNGQIVVGGQLFETDRLTSRGIARYHPTGQLDQDFHNRVRVAGEVTTLLVLPDDKFVVGGSFATVNGQSRANLARLNRDGSLDLGFTPPSDYAAAVAKQPDGRLYVAYRNQVVRLNGDGSLDTSFPPILANGWVSAIRLQTDGQILIAGAFSSVNGLPRRAIARLHNEGGRCLLKAGSRISAHAFPLTVIGIPGATYRIEVSSDLFGWHPLLTITNTFETIQCLDTNLAAARARFYRARLLK